MGAYYPDSMVLWDETWSYNCHDMKTVKKKLGCKLLTLISQKYAHG